MILLDTDHLSIVTDFRAAANSELVRRLEASREPLGVPIISVEEQCQGWLAKIHRTQDVEKQISAYERLKDLFEFFEEWDIISFDATAASLFKQLRKQKVRIGSQDLKIAAVALTYDALLLSANERDFGRVPGLRVANWLAP